MRTCFSGNMYMFLGNDVRVFTDCRQGDAGVHVVGITVAVETMHASSLQNRHASHYKTGWIIRCIALRCVICATARCVSIGS